MNQNSEVLNKWTKGIAYEIAFWNNVYRWRHTFEGMMGWSRYGKEIQLEEFDVSAFLMDRESPVVLDVGCGMSYATGNHLSRNGQLEAIDIHYIDPLADYFNEILTRYHRDLPPIEFGMMEYLSSFYPQHNVDLVMIQNALDHSANPTKGILEALDALMVGGVLYLNHHPNEAEMEHYKGFHQYNITRENDRLVIWNKENRIDVNEMVKGFADIKVSVHDNGHVVAVIKKTDNVPDELLNVKEDRAVMAQMLIDMSKCQGSVWQSFCYKIKYLTYNTIQFFAQALPWDKKMALKKLIKQA